MDSMKVIIFLGIVGWTLTHQLIDLHKEIPSIIIDLKYASPENFTHKTIYSNASCYAHKDLIPRLKRVQKALKKKKLSLKMWDAYRPPHAQQKLWKFKPNTQYISHPQKGRHYHQRGIALDVTLVDLKTGKELSMPTEFDDFSNKAHHSYEGLSQTKRKNRNLLKSTMTKEGFIPLSSEWWHYMIKNWQDYPILDIKFN